MTARRYEITGCATDVFALTAIQGALRKVGAVRVSARCAFGWSNQPRVATFSAADDRAARDVCEQARATLNHPSSLPSLLPHAYQGVPA